MGCGVVFSWQGCRFGHFAVCRLIPRGGASVASTCHWHILRGQSVPRYGVAGLNGYDQYVGMFILRYHSMQFPVVMFPGGGMK